QSRMQFDGGTWRLPNREATVLGRRMVYALSVCHHSHVIFAHRVLESCHRPTFIFLPRLRRDRLWVCLLSPRKFLGRGAATMEPLQQLWRAVSCAMGHHGALSLLTDLPLVSATLVFELFLPSPFSARRHGHVFPGLSLGR